MDTRDGTGELRRKALQTLTKKNSPGSYYANGVLKDSFQSRKFPTEKLYAMHHKYIGPVLDFWKNDPRPEYLFERNMWEKWLVEVDRPRFMLDPSLHTFATTMLRIFSDPGEPYLGQVKKILDSEQIKRLDILCLKYNQAQEDEEDRRLAAKANATFQNGDVNFTDVPDPYDFDNCVWVEGTTSPLKSYTREYVSPKRSREMSRSSSPDLLFSNYEQSSVVSSHISSSSNGKLSRKRKKKNSTKRNRMSENVEQAFTDKENYPVTVDEKSVKYPKPPSAPQLTLEMFEVIKEALDKPPKEKVVSGFSLYILQEDLALFNNETEWLNDRNIDFYLELIRERGTRDGYPRVYIFHSFFYTLLTDKDGGYEAVAEATGEDDVFDYDIVFFPVNLSQHWRLVVFKPSEKKLECYDSMKHDNYDVLKSVGKYLHRECKRRHSRDDQTNGYVSEGDSFDGNSPINQSINGIPEEEVSTGQCFNLHGLDIENMSSDAIPQQKNAIDCGIFVLQFAEYLSRAQEFDFDQTHIPYFRQRMVYETITKQLLPALG